ncbi:hypothetical protein [Luteimonas viscosa]|uniref:hypothetical protein n=1 Tax=Luteimonas viscosa TaxID=1132694 RepID=UPI0021CCC7BD|nr:hypothetical protein [Luteimonas viscosa]
MPSGCTGKVAVGLVHQQGAGNADHDADHAAAEREQHRLGQEPAAHVAGPGVDRHAQPISRTRSVTDTSMMFMPMPPAISEIVATAPGSAG